jgi:uncharacterized protein involved in outer membrane biogenesis
MNTRITIHTNMHARMRQADGSAARVLYPSSQAEVTSLSHHISLSLSLATSLSLSLHLSLSLSLNLSLPLSLSTSLSLSLSTPSPLFPALSLLRAPLPSGMSRPHTKTHTHTHTHTPFGPSGNLAHASVTPPLTHSVGRSYRASNLKPR